MGSISVDSTDAENRLQQIVVPSAVKVLVKRKRLTVLRQREKDITKIRNDGNKWDFISDLLDLKEKEKRTEFCKPIEKRTNSIS